MYRTLIRTRTICDLYLRHAQKRGKRAPPLLQARYITYTVADYVGKNTIITGIRSHYRQAINLSVFIILQDRGVIKRKSINDSTYRDANCKVQTWRFPIIISMR